MTDDLPLSERRNRGLNDLAAVVTELWGHRCSRHEGKCGCCAAWVIFDALEKLTDSSELEAQGSPRTGESSLELPMD